MQLLPRVRQFVRQHALFRADTRLVAALSGGSDSVALVQIMRELFGLEGAPDEAALADDPGAVEGDRGNVRPLPRRASQ